MFVDKMSTATQDWWQWINVTGVLELRRIQKLNICKNG